MIENARREAENLSRASSTLVNASTIGGSLSPLFGNNPALPPINSSPSSTQSNSIFGFYYDSESSRVSTPHP